MKSITPKGGSLILAIVVLILVVSLEIMEWFFVLRGEETPLWVSTLENWGHLVVIAGLVYLVISLWKER